MDYSIRHIPAAGRFETQVEGYTGYVEYALLPQGVMDIRHTIVPKEIGGKGIAAALVKFAVEYARSGAEGATFVRICRGIPAAASGIRGGTFRSLSKHPPFLLFIKISK